MSKCYIDKTTQIKMNQEQLVTKIKQKVASDPRLQGLGKLFSIETNQDSISKLIEKLPEEAGDAKGMIGVSAFIDSEHDIKNVDGSITTKQLSPEFRVDSYIEEFVKQALERGQDPEEAKKEVTQQLADSTMEQIMGTMQHALISELFKNGGNTDTDDFRKICAELRKHFNDTYVKDDFGRDLKLDDTSRTLFQILTSEPGSELLSLPREEAENRIIQTLVDNASQIYNMIKKQYGKNAKFYTEHHISTKNCKTPKDNWSGIHGYADLIVVKEDGSIDIIDFKVSNRFYDSWCSAKLYHTEYQLGAYRAILAANGVPIKNIGLKVLPIYLNKLNGVDSEVEKLESLDNKIYANGNSHLDWRSGSFTDTLSKLISYNESLTPQESLKALEGVDKFVTMTGYNPVQKQYDREALIEKIKKSEKEVNGKKEYSMWDYVKGEQITASTLQAFTKPDGIVDNYLFRRGDYRHQIADNIYETFIKYKKEGTSAANFDFLNSKSSRGGKDLKPILDSILGEFFKSYYEILDIPLLRNYGILAFINTQTGTCHFITITDQSLSATYADGKFGTVLGNYISNDQIRVEDNLEVLLANVLNAEALKTVHILNCLEEANPGFFANKKIGSIRVLSPNNNGENNIVPIKALKQNYARLCHYSGIKDNFSSKIPTADPWTELVMQIDWVISSSESLEKEHGAFVRKIKQYDNSKNDRYAQKTTRGKIQKLIELRKLMEQEFPRFRTKSFLDNQYYDLTDPIDQLFYTINTLITHYLNIPIDASGNYDKYGLHGSSLMELLGMPIVRNQGFTDSKGRIKRGFANGLFMTSAENSPSPTLKALSEYYEVAYSQVREDFLAASKNITNITIPYINSNMSKANRIFSGISTGLWEKFLVKDTKGNIAPVLQLKNPYEDSTLSKDESEFLKAILWEINKYRLPELSQYRNLTYAKNKEEIDGIIVQELNEKVNQTKEYFELPLKKARYFERWKKVGRIGVTSLCMSELESLRDDWDLTKEHSAMRSKISQEIKKNATTMYNQYQLSHQEREYLLEQSPIEDFEIDLDMLALDVAYQSIRKEYFEEVLQTTAAVATMLHINQAVTGVNRHPELEALDVRQNSALKNKGDVDEEHEDVAKVITAARKLNSLLVLAFRPLQMVKELTFGQFTNYSRVLGLRGSSEKLSLSSVFHANNAIWGQSIGKWAGVFSGNAEMASYTLCESLNKLYGIANEDISTISDKAATSRFGVLANLSKYAYLANSAPDYFNRLTLFVAKMMEDGCWEAHSLDKNGNLVYDFKKDKRFSELNKHGLNSDYKGEKYLEQKALYLAMAEQFAKEDKEFITYDRNGKVIYKEFDRAYTNKERNSIKEVADMAYGYYDHETKSLVDIGFFGLIYRQFQTFLTAKTNLWFRGRSITKGSNTAQGRFKQVTINGEKCYKRITQTENGLITETVPESQMRPEEKGILEPVYQWQGDYVEGLCYSIMGTLNSLFHGKLSEITGDSELAKYRRGNLAIAMHDILIGMILFAIFKWLFSGGTKKMQDIKPLQRTLLRAMQDVSPSAITSMDWEPGFYSTLVNLREDAVKIFSQDDVDIEKMIRNRVGAIKDWTYNDRD